MQPNNKNHVPRVQRRAATAAMLLVALLGGGGAGAQQQPAQPLPTAPAANLAPPAQQARFRAIYKELVETNTTDSAGSCTNAANAMAAHLRRGGYADSDIHLLVHPGNPAKGNLVARLKGTGEKKPLLLLAHMDVVEAKREDWTRDPFKLVEENGMLYARGASDDKAMAAAFVSNMVRYKEDKLLPKRDIILALTCDEEIVPSKFSGIDYLLKNHRPLIDAELALNEGGGGALDKNEKPVSYHLQIGEKVFVTYQLEVTNPGGHSARPVRDNAIYHLADGLSRLGKFDFPIVFTPTTRAYLERLSKIEADPKVAGDMRAMLANPTDTATLERLYAVNASYNASLRTTCVATMVDAGHATNALPQRARATVNCRILPGESVDEVQKTIVRVLADDKIKVSPTGEAMLSPPPPLSPAVLQAVESTVTDMWPGVPVIPTMLVATTDGRFLNNLGIWTYGVGGFGGVENSGVHGLNEHIRAKSLDEEHEFLYRVAKKLAVQ
jgi:acetylornithine deacetylase/succinyl-diaminopimelate desuccinylase-like protein